MMIEIVTIITEYLWIIFLGLGGFLSLIALLDKEKGNNWLYKKWQAIGESKVIKLPELVIKWVIKSANNSYVIGLKLVEKKYSLIIFILCLGMLDFYLYKVLNEGNISTFRFIQNILSKGAMALFLIYDLYIRNRNFPYEIGILGSIILNIIAVYFPFKLYIILTSDIISFNAASYIFIFGMPFIFYIVFLFQFWALKVFFEIKKLKHTKRSNSIITFNAFTISSSIALTFIAFNIGKYFEPTSITPRNFQFFSSNLIFDGLSIFISIFLLNWSIKKLAILRIPFVILSIFIFSGLLAYLSGYFGLLNSEFHISNRELYCNALGRSFDNNTFYLGCLFWSMNSVFIPIILTISLITFTYLGKLFLFLIYSFFRPFAEKKYSILLTGAYLGFTATCLTILLFFLG